MKSVYCNTFEAPAIVCSVNPFKIFKEVNQLCVTTVSLVAAIPALGSSSSSSSCSAAVVATASTMAAAMMAAVMAAVAAAE